MVTRERFFFSGTTSTFPADAGALEKIVGCGSSPVVNYPGRGIYFLDKVKEGVWRLEVYPDALLIEDPFARPNPDKAVCRLIRRRWPMIIDIPDLGKDFDILPVNKKNT